MIYDFILSHNATEATKHIRCTKGEGEVDHTTVTRWLKKCRSSCLNLDDQARWGKLKIEDSEAMFEAIETNLVSSTRRVSGELGISQSVVVSHIHDLFKIFH